jgi:AcrR family transcriptional regulator
VVRDASDTRERLLDSAQHLFAREGIHQVPLNRVVQHAGQRNASALHYHYGGREGLLHAIIVRANEPIQAERKEMLARIEADGKTDDLRRLVEALVIPISRLLATESGREYLQIVSQLSVLFDFWDVDLPGGPTETQRMYYAIRECMPDLGPELRHARITTFLGLVTEALASRARSLDSEPSLAPAVDDDDMFVTNLVDMAIGALLAPSTIASARV